MVLIHLKSQYVSLLVTVLSGFAELSLFAAALGFNRLAECHALKHGKGLSVRLHRMRTRFLAIFAMVVFIVLEVFMSFYSDPHVSPDTEPRRCLAVDRYDVRSGDIFDFTTDAVLYTCARADGDRIFQHIGNRSIPDDHPDALRPEVVCAESASYMFSGEGVVNMTLTANQTQSCMGAFCIHVELRGREFVLSQLINATLIDFIIANNIEVEFLVTSLLFDLDRDQESVLGQRVLEAFAANVTDPMALRHRALLSSDKTICPFLLSKEPTVTNVPLALICALVTCWALSVLAFVSTLLLKRQLFYDMSDPLDWALHTHRQVDEPFAENPVVTSVYEHGERLMYVSSSSPDEYHFLKGAATSLRERFKRFKKPVSDASVEEQPV